MRVGDVIELWVYSADAPSWQIRKEKAYGLITDDGEIEMYGWSFKLALEEPVVFSEVTNSPHYSDWAFYMVSPNPNDEARFYEETVSFLAKWLFNRKERERKQ